MSDIAIEKNDHVALVEIQRPPNNFFDIALIQDIAAAFEGFDEDGDIRAIVLAAQGKAFCAGANFGDGSALDDNGQRPTELSRQQAVQHLYMEGNRLFRTKKPIIAAVHGAAVGGGLGLAMVADFRVTCPEARFCANFTRLGFHPGFGLTVTLPAVIGQTKAAMMFYTSRRVPATKPSRWVSPMCWCRRIKCARRRSSSPPRSRRIRRSAWSPRAPPCAAISPTACARPPSTNCKSRRVCAPPTTSRKASRRWRSGGFRISPVADRAERR